MTKKELIEAISKKMKVKQKESKLFLKTFQDILLKEVKMHRTVKIINLMSIDSKKQPSKQVRNPRTGVYMQAAEKYIVKITPAALLKAAANKSLQNKRKK